MTPTHKFPAHPLSAPGDFYVVNGECLACGMPHVAAPELMGWSGQKGSHCIWRRQPENAVELTHAIKVLETQELGCHRYAGTDRAVLALLASSYCDYPLQENIVTRELEYPRFSMIESNSLLGRIWKRLNFNKARG